MCSKSVYYPQGQSLLEFSTRTDRLTMLGDLFIPSAYVSAFDDIDPELYSYSEECGCYAYGRTRSTSGMTCRTVKTRSLGTFHLKHSL